MFKLLVVEDHALVREGLLLTLRGLARGAKPLGVSDSTAALAELESNPDIDLVLLDLMLPGLNGMAFLGVLRQRFPAIPVVVLSALDDVDTVRRAMRYGASGFVSKASSSESLLDALRKVLAGDIYLPQVYAEVSAKSVRRLHLTPSQRRVLVLLSEGKSNREMAELLDVTEGTIKVHLVAVFKALNVGSRSQALLAIKRRRIRF